MFPGFKPQVAWGKLLNNSTAVFAVNDTVHLVDFNKKKGTYHVPGVNYIDHVG